MSPDAGAMLYRLLPDYIRSADEAGDGTVGAILGAAGAGLQPAVDLLTLADPATSVTGGCELADPWAAPRWALEWLGWLIGVPTTGIPAVDLRATLADAASVRRGGSIGAIHAAAQRTLTGSRKVRVYSNLSGTDPYLITVITATSQTPNPVATLAAVWDEKPAGVDLQLQVIAGSTYDELAAAWPTYSDLAAEFATYDDMTSWIP